jgi:nucleosome binding factor SPN SPT16 subunit
MKFLANEILRALLTAKILSQVQSGDTPVPIEIFAQARAKDPPTDALPKFAEIYLSQKCVGTLLKESHSGRLITEWESAIAEATNTPTVVEVGPALSSFMAVKDEEELASSIHIELCSIC